MINRIETYIPFDKAITDRIEIPIHLNDKPRKEIDMSGVVIRNWNGHLTKSILLKGISYGVFEALNGDISVGCHWNGEMNGYYFYEDKTGFGLRSFDMGEEIELIKWNMAGDLVFTNSLMINRSHMDIDSFMAKYSSVIDHIDKVAHGPLYSSLIEVSYLGCGVEMELGQRLTWAYERKLRMKKGMYTENSDFLPYYIQQLEMLEKVITHDELPDKISFIGGVDVSYNENELKMIGAIVVLNSVTLEIVEESFHEMDITFPYVPGLFSFREIPPIIEAYKKLKIKPEIIVCDGHGIAHPKKMGMATHLGIELNIPTIGCAKRRLIGVWEKDQLDHRRGSSQPLIWQGEKVGNVLRTQNDIKPVFVSTGHKVNLETATSIVLRLCTKYRLPETTRQSDQLVNKIMKERTEIKFMDRDEE